MQKICNNLGMSSVGNVVGATYIQKKKHLNKFYNNQLYIMRDIVCFQFNNRTLDSSVYNRFKKM